MGSSSASEDRYERPPSKEFVTAVASDLHSIVPGGVESKEQACAKAPACSQANMASSGPGSEYWLP